jgi:hypothetical protein
VFWQDAATTRVSLMRALFSALRKLVSSRKSAGKDMGIQDRNRALIVRTKHYSSIPTQPSAAHPDLRKAA